MTRNDKIQKNEYREVFKSENGMLLFVEYER
jgi:hypothetical protein